MINFRRFDLDGSIVARTIYGEQPHRVSNRGVVLPPEIRAELEQLLHQYAKHIDANDPAYYRIDCYFDSQRLSVLEINTAFVDGWGTALNLSRAAKIPVKTAPLVKLPGRIATIDPIYLPEVQLFADELQMWICQNLEIEEEFEGTHYPAPDLYVYGRVKEKFPHVYPYRGYELDNKMHLARFERDEWRGEEVWIPQHYVHGRTAWSEIPESAVLKFCEKGGVESERARASVILGKPQGKAKFLRFCYESERLIAQEQINPKIDDDDRFFCQLVILAINSDVVCGYVQYSGSLIITDNSIHGPLLIE